MSGAVSVLDAAQLKRIEAVHRGFLYQHLFTVACLLKAAEAKVTSIIVEADEDVELARDSGRTYMQIKTRTEPLHHSDIKDALARFDLLRTEHKDGKRAGTASFAVISNAAPGAKLLKELQSGDWPKDVAVCWPGHPSSDNGLIEPWASLEGGAASCAALAAALPFGALLPDTLVMKLASLVMAAAAGAPPRTDHTFKAEELPALFEQFVIQLQDFPAPPPHYRPLNDEPALFSDRQVRAITGLSGAGKTAWIAHAAIHTAKDLAYFDIGDTPSTAITIPLSRELAGRFFGKGGGLGNTILPGSTGLDMLRAIDKRLAAEDKQPLVVIDNAHRVSADDLLAVTKLTPNIKYILLCQPGPTSSALQTVHNVPSEGLKGWDSDAIAADAAAVGCIVTANSVAKVAELTGGLPLYVQNAMRIALAEYHGNLAIFCQEVAALTHNVETAQELILSRTFKALSKPAQDIAAVLSQSDIALTKTEAEEICTKALNISPQSFAVAIRELRPVGAIEMFGVDSIKVHDAIRLLGRTYLSSFDAGTLKRCQIALREVLLKSVIATHNPLRFSLYIRLLSEMGEVKPLIQFATDELFHELGMFSEITDVLEKASQNEAIAPDQRFAALDGLVFAALRESNVSKAAAHLEAMSAIADNHELDATDRANLANKIMLHASQAGNSALVDEQAKKLTQMFPNDPLRDRIMRYNVAHANFKLGRFKECLLETGKLIREYYSALGITPLQVMGRNPDKLWELLDRKVDHTDSLKHLADTLDLQAHAADNVGDAAPFARIHAIKLYAMVNALESVARVGQDLTDEMIGRADYIGARMVLETNVLPHVIQLKMTEYILPVRRQYAVVLAYCGDHAAAQAEMDRMKPYEAGLSEVHLREYRSQLALIEQLRVVPPRPQFQMPEGLTQRMAERMIQPKIGRNKPCFCGSGVKYKKCHGRD